MDALFFTATGIQIVLFLSYSFQRTRQTLFFTTSGIQTVLVFSGISPDCLCGSYILGDLRNLSVCDGLKDTADHGSFSRPQRA